MLVRTRRNRIEPVRSPVVHSRANLLEVRHLAKRFGAHQAVVDIGFSLQSGEVLGLLGPNGAGKSTCMMMIAGLLRPDTGDVIINGRSFNGHDPQLKRMLGLVPQELAIYPDLSATENLQFFGRLYGLNRSELKSRCDDVLEQIGLTDSAHRPSGTYSGGMKRRLNFGIALIHQPSILILDEPTVGVDPQSRSHLLDCVREQARSGAAVIYASHYMEEVQAICERVAIVDHGKVLACDGRSSLLNGLATDLRIHIVGDGDVRGRLAGLVPFETGADGQHVVVLSGACSDIGGRLRSVLHHLMAARVRITHIESQQSNLERLFLHLTGYGLRD